MQRFLALLVSVTAAVAVFLATAAVLGAFPVPLVIDGLTAPRGLTPTDDGGLLIAEVGAGRILEMGPEGEISVIEDGIPFTLISGPGNKYPAGPSAVVESEGAYYYVVGGYIEQGFSELYRLEPGGTPDPVTGQQIQNRFGSNALTNPYDLVEAPDGFLMSDSGINQVLHVSTDGEISEYVVFPRRQTPEGIEGPAEYEVVPTGLTRGPDGAVYVASLTGFPYPEGEARIYRLADSVGSDPDVYADGFSAVTDIAFEEDGGLLVTEYSTDMRALAEDDIRQAERHPGRLVRWRDGEIAVVADGLVSPSAVAITDGRIFVSEEFAGRVSEVPTGAGSDPWVWAWAAASGVAVLLLGRLALRRLSRR